MVSIGIAGASGYAGGELLRILLQHPEVDIRKVTSQNHAGEFVFKVHPNLRGLTNLKFTGESPEQLATEVDILFMAVPHGSSASVTPKVVEQGTRVIDLSADFRLHNPDDYMTWYHWAHPAPDLLDKFVYGLPEFHRDAIKNAKNIAVPGCLATSSIYSLAPLAKSGYIRDTVVIDGKIGSSGSGNKTTPASHFSERYNSIRIYSPSGHRHIGEIEQELSLVAGKPVSATMSAHSMNMVRGILTTSTAFTDGQIEDKELWRAFRNLYRDEKFIRLMMDKSGIYRYPDPKLVVGSNFADLGFAMDHHVDRIVAIGAIDNLIKGTAGNAVQCMNIMMGFNEGEALLSAPMRLV